jgi:predicted translin family RNA/ssDNA-binding protein
MAIIKKQFMDKLREDHAESERERRQIIAGSNDVLHGAKRAIFALHRGDRDGATASLADLEGRLKEMAKRFGNARLLTEGSYRAAAEEFVEARALAAAVAGKPFDRIAGVAVDHEGYLAGLSDLTGELVRRAINQAADGNTAEVIKLKAAVEEVLADLVELDLGGYLRTKYDQARQNLKKIEHIAYELAIRK